jgi:hypothetical protein
VGVGQTSGPTAYAGWQTEGEYPWTGVIVITVRRCGPGGADRLAAARSGETFGKVPAGGRA